MVLPVQFQLGLELTNIVNPISQAVSALGSLALVDAIRKSGSDAITETKLASLIGRHRIDPIIKTHFHEAVSKADQSVISRYVDIILESGSGPTVQESLKNPALFSMVIQLSALAFSQEDEPLSNAIVEAIERIVRESGRNHDLVPYYVALLGTIRACQQQTVAFRWSCLYEAVEYRIQDALRIAKGNAPKRRKLAMDVYSAHATMKRWQSLQQRCLPFPVLQALLMWLQALQSFPENRLLHLRCDSGISTIVVWCYHILGLSLVVNLEGCEIRFGDAPVNIVVEESEAQEVGATLMDPKGSNEPLFTLTDNDGNPMIGSEIRAEACGYGLEVLKRAGASKDDTRHCLEKVIAESLKIARRSSNYHLPRGPANDSPTELGENNASSRLLEPYFPSEERILQAGRFLFAQSLLDLPAIESLIVPPIHEKPTISRSVSSRLVAVLITFARINEDDLEKCSRMPLSLSVLELSNWAGYQPAGSDARDIDLLNSFETLSHLLLGHMFSREYVSPAVLVSGWGWSIFFNSVDAVDPADISINTMRVLCGVPTLRGFRRARIIDGPTGTRMSFTTAKTVNKDPGIDFFPGVSTAKRGLPLVGYHSDAFQDFAKCKSSASKLTCLPDVSMMRLDPMCRTG
ncbi:hypothetical protein OEA41_001673 [Lepraria neglecta]|uniref:Uncharacterized protein n=1 Tax=Lepraria neglecta TaxID=209136 RepID=A0AAD9ZCT4_9LECA|nr:hypothetical protein OEA41_001673 [Lepraria neglecta]